MKFFCRSGVARERKTISSSARTFPIAAIAGSPPSPPSPKPPAPKARKIIKCDLFSVLHYEATLPPDVDDPVRAFPALPLLRHVHPTASFASIKHKLSPRS